MSLQTTEPKPQPIALRFRDEVQRDAEKYLREVLGTEQGRAAAARVALAFSAAARAAKDPGALYDCSRASIVAAVAMSAITNLMPGGAHPTVWLVPKGGELQWWMSHRGIGSLSLRGGYQLIAMPVHVEDEVRVEFGEVLEHNPDPDRWPTSLDEIRGCYLTIRRLSDGATLARPWLPVEAIRQRMNKAQTKAVWNDWPIEMAQKTVIKWAMARGYVPIETSELQMALEAEPVDGAPPAQAPAATGLRSLGLDESHDDLDNLAAKVAADRAGTDKVEVGPRASLAEECRAMEEGFDGPALSAIRAAAQVPDQPASGKWAEGTLRAYRAALEVARQDGGREPGMEG